MSSYQMQQNEVEKTKKHDATDSKTHSMDVVHDHNPLSPSVQQSKMPSHVYHHALPLPSIHSHTNSNASEDSISSNISIMKSRPTINTNMLSPDFNPSHVSGKNSWPVSLDTPMSGYTAATHQSHSDGERSHTPRNPFNFVTQQYTAENKILNKGDLGRRKGHKYKHSSVSHQIFQTPAPRPPLNLPISLPIPTSNEFRGSLTNEQRKRISWCICHFLVAAFVQWVSRGSLSITALSRLLFFDATGAAVCALVDIMGNFEVWKRASLRHPFGLERLDVLAGFGLAVFIAFMGFDILSHGIEHTLERTGGHVPHHVHEERKSSSITLAALSAIITTLVSAILLKNHARISRAMRVDFMAGWGNILGNPSHFMTLSFSTILLFISLFHGNDNKWVDTILSGVIAIAMITLGARLGIALSSILLMSYSGPGGLDGITSLINEMEADPMISEIQEVKFWQIHYGLAMATLKLKYKSSAYGDDVAAIRKRLTKLIQDRLGGGNGSGRLKWEITTQLVIER